MHRKLASIVNNNDRGRVDGGYIHSAGWILSFSFVVSQRRVEAVAHFNSYITSLNNPRVYADTW